VKIFIIIIIIFFSKICFSDEYNNFYESRYNFIKDYISKLKSLQKKNKDYKGSVVETISGSLHVSFGTQSQEEIDKQALQKCEEKVKEKKECKVRFQSLKKNKNYNRAARYNKSNEILNFLENKIKSKYIYEYNGIIFLRSNENFNTRNYSCKKSTMPVNMIVNLIKKEIDIYPKFFLDNSGLKYIMLCDDANLNGNEVGGFAPGHYDQSPGIFFINIKNLSGKEDYLKHLFHHEFYHIIDTRLTNLSIDDEWNSINKNYYLNSKIIGDSALVLTPDNSTKGFVSQYARKNQAEDKAELFAMLITRNKDIKKLLKKDEILYKKVKLLISRLKNISPSINKDFWNKIN
jgi:hypothetical protein